jgi:hypothetical protein
MFPTDLSLEIKAITPHVFRVPIEVPVVTSFGDMRDRPLCSCMLRRSTAMRATSRRSGRNTASGGQLQ